MLIEVGLIVLALALAFAAGAAVGRISSATETDALKALLEDERARVSDLLDRVQAPTVEHYKAMTTPLPQVIERDFHYDDTGLVVEEVDPE